MLTRDRYRSIRIDRHDAVAVLTLDRPEHGNSVDDSMHSELSTVFADARRDKDVRAIVLTGAGAAFCTGGDASQDRTFTTLTGLTPIEEAQRIVESLLDLEQPLIAAVNGPALGLGAILASLADTAYMARSASIGDRHVAGGVTAGNGSAALWPTLIGLNRAKHLLLDAAVLTAEQAVEIGLVHEVVADGEALDTALALAQRWAAMPAFAMQSTKAVLNAHLRAAASVGLRYGLALEERALAGTEFAEMRARALRSK